MGSGRAAGAALAARQQWLAEHARLQRRAAVLHRDLQVPASADLRAVMAEMHATEQDADRARAKESERMRASLKHIRTLAGRVGRLIATGGSGRDYLDALRTAMESAEAEMLGFRARERTTYGDLARSEAELTRELEDAASTFHAWAQERPSARLGGGRGENRAGAAAAAKPKVTKLARVPDHLAMPEEVRELDDAIAADGGPTGGWSKDDHAAFVALLARLAPPPAPGAAASGTRRPRKSKRAAQRRGEGAADNSSASSDDDWADAREAAAFEQGLRARPRRRARYEEGKGVVPGDVAEAASKRSAPTVASPGDGKGSASDNAASNPSVGMELPRAKVAAFCRRAAARIPGHDAAEVEQHYAWYRTYCDRLAAKKSAVAAWRERRAKAVAGAEDSGSVASDQPAGASAAAAELSPGAAKRRERARRAAAQEKRERVAAWKAQKEIEAAEREAEAAMKRQAEREAAERREARERERKRAALEEYQRSKDEERARAAASEAILSPAPRRSPDGAASSVGTPATVSSFSPEQQLRRAEADIERAARKRRELMAKRADEVAAAMAAMAPRSKPAVAAERDPERLTRPTKAFESHSKATLQQLRQRADTGDRPAHEGFVASTAGARDARGHIAYTFGVGGRAGASWRAGL